jgi:hypothetical protein
MVTLGDTVKRIFRGAVQLVIPSAWLRGTLEDIAVDYWLEKAGRPIWRDDLETPIDGGRTVVRDYSECRKSLEKYAQDVCYIINRTLLPDEVEGSIKKKRGFRGRLLTATAPELIRDTDKSRSHANIYERIVDGEGNVLDERGPARYPTVALDPHRVVSQLGEGGGYERMLNKLIRVAKKG